MKIQFKYSRAINGKVYDKGVHELPDSLSGHWYLDALVKCGDAVVVQPVIDQQSLVKEEIIQDEEKLPEMVPNPDDEPKQTKKAASKKGK